RQHDLCARVGFLDEFTELRLSCGDRDSLHAFTLGQSAWCFQAVIDLRHQPEPECLREDCGRKRGGLEFRKMKAAEAPQAPVRGAEVWPLSVEAYHALGEARLIPERTELLYGFVYHKMSKSPLHTFLVLRLL